MKRKVYQGGLCPQTIHELRDTGCRNGFHRFSSDFSSYARSLSLFCSFKFRCCVNLPVFLFDYELVTRARCLLGLSVHLKMFVTL